MPAGAALTFPFADPPPPGGAVEVAAGVLWLRLPLPMALDHVNAYALDEGDGWSVVDPGMDTPAARASWSALLAGPLAGRPVARVIVTHHHPDHVGLAGWLTLGGAELVIPRTAWLYARMLTLDVQERPSPEALALWRAAGMDRAEIDRRAALRPFNFADCVAPMRPGFTRLSEGQTLRLGGRDWTVRLGHGHAPDHATLWCADEGLVLGGDQFLPGITPHIGVYPTEPEADPLGEWLESCARFALLARADDLVLPGHRRPFRGLPARLAEMQAHHAAALDRLCAHLERPRSAVDCFPALFRREIGTPELGLAIAEALAHLNHLHRRGEITRSLRPDGTAEWRRPP
jgi:glyoxylase-like metal-dependent hydrolase (beta-lactamase superfamily II)